MSTGAKWGVGRLGWWLRDYVYAGQRQLESLFRRTLPPRYSHGDPGRPAVILLPGVYESWLFLEPAASRLNACGFRIFAIPALGLNRRTIPDSSAIVASALAELSARHKFSECIILAHSKGGLIGKRLMLDAQAPSANLTHDADGRPCGAAGTAAVLGMVTIATPFSGSNYARYLVVRTLRDFSPSDAVLLAMQGQAGLNHKIVSIYPEFDPHIPSGSALEGAANIELPVSGHFRTLADQTVLAAVEQAVKELAGQE